jgi:elongation factor G
MYCKKCGGKVESYASHCPFCGEPMAANDVTATYTTSIPVQRTHSHKNIGRWILTYFLMNLPVVGIIMLFVWAFGAKSKEDPTFTYHEDNETGQLIISGMGELHLDVLVTRMKDDFGVKARVGAPQVTYRESVSGTAEITEEYSKVLGGKENTAGITVKVEQRKQGEGNSYVCTASRNNIPEEIFAAVENGFRSSLDAGINYGYPCTDTAITVTKIEYNELTATTFAYEACAAQAFDKVCNAANPQVLEPVMNVDI